LKQYRWVKKHTHFQTRSNIRYIDSKPHNTFHITTGQ
jgi:hypothetical protein